MNKNSISSLSFIMELINPRMRHGIPSTNTLFVELKEVYANCNRISDDLTELSFLSQATPETRKCVIKGDRIIILNDFTSSTLEGFLETSEYVLRTAVKILKIPLFIFRQHTVRLTAALLRGQDSRVFLGNKVSRLEDSKLKVLKRRIHGCGLRFVFAPEPGNQSEYLVRVESFLRDTSLIFLENQARFFKPIQIQPDIDYAVEIRDELKRTYSFLTENVSDFLVQYNQ